MARKRKSYNRKKGNPFVVLIGIIIIFIVAISTNEGYINKNIQCKQIRQHLCTKYEVEKYIEEK